MSRVGKQPIALPKEVKAKIEGNFCSIQGSKHTMQLAIHEGIKIKIEENSLLVERENDSKQLKSMHGTVRALIANMVKGVTEGFKKELAIVGVGYKAQMKGKNLVLNLGFSHPIEMEIPEGLKVSTSSPTRIAIEGVDRQKVGEFAAKIRRIYPPEPYKGKGVRYVGEEVRKKLGKALAK